MADKKSSKRLILVLIIVGLVVLSIPCIGIAAAVAIPAFLRYIKASKTSERR